MSLIVVCMTSWVKRINNVKPVVENVMKGTLQPDRLYLSLSVSEFPNKELDIPKDLVEYFESDNRLIINWVEGENTKTMKKVFPVLQYLEDDDIIIPIGGYVIVACKRGAQNSFTLSDLYSTSQLGENKTIIYQNKVILANDGETITLYNTVNDIVDQMYYDGTSHKTNPNRLYAENEDGISGEQCISLHRTWVEFDNNGKIRKQRCKNTLYTFFIILSNKVS